MSVVSVLLDVWFAFIAAVSAVSMIVVGVKCIAMACSDDDNEIVWGNRVRPRR